MNLLAITSRRTAAAPFRAAFLGAALTLALAAPARVFADSGQTINNFVAPDAWTRGDANTTYYGWTSLGFGFGPASTALNTTTPGLGTVPTPAPLFKQNNPTPANIIGSGTVYSGFATTFDLNLDIVTNGTVATGFTTVVLQFVGSTFGGTPTPNNIDGLLLNGLAPTYTTSGFLADGKQLTWSEWLLTGNDLVSTLHITSTLTSASITMLTVDTGWNATSQLQNTVVTSIVPEPSVWALGAGCAALGLVVLRRRARLA